MHVVTEHVEAGAGRRQQHRIAFVRLAGGHLDRFRQRGRSQDRIRRAASSDRPFDERGVATDQHHRARRARQRARQRREILALAIAAEDDCQAQPLGGQAVEGGDGGADIGSLAVVVVVHTADGGDQLHPVRLASVAAQRVQHRRQRAADRPRQRQRCERVAGVVPAADRQRVRRHQPMNVELLRRRFLRAFGPSPAMAVRQVLGVSEPGDPVVGQQTVLVRLRRWLQAEGHDRRGLSGHHRHRRVVAIEHLHSARREDARLGPDVGIETAMPVEVVLRDVQHRGRVAGQRARGRQLEARQLQHPGLGQAILAQALAQRVERRRRDVAGDGNAAPGARDQQPGKPRRRRLAVGAGDADHPRRIAAARLQRRQRAGKELDLADHVDAALLRRRHQRRGGRVRRRQAGRQRQHRRAVEQRGGKIAAAERDLRQLGAQRGEHRRRGPRVGDADRRPAVDQGARHGQARLAETQHHRNLAGRLDHRIFRVDRPTSTSMMVMIQNRTTTWFSFHPESSKWWCSGAMRKMRLPPVNLK